MGPGFGDHVAAAIGTIMILVFFAGMAAAGVAWLLWYYVLSRITVGWV